MKPSKPFLGFQAPFFYLPTEEKIIPFLPVFHRGHIQADHRADISGVCTAVRDFPH